MGAAFGEGILKVGNKPEARAALIDEIAGLLKEGVFPPARAAQLRGRLAWAASNLFGRCGAKACEALSAHAARGGPNVILDEGTAAALRWWMRFLEVAADRCVCLDKGGPPVLIFTDGAFEAGVATVGGVLWDPADGAFEFFGGVVGKELVKKWQATGIEQVIGQAEILPALLARLLWQERLVGRRSLNFIDNDAAREGLIRGRSRSQASAELLDCFWEVEARLAGSSWFSRVPSPSNIADAPSRLEFSHPALEGAVHRSLPPVQLCLLQE